MKTIFDMNQFRPIHFYQDRLITYSKQEPNRQNSFIFTQDKVLKQDKLEKEKEDASIRKH